MVGQIAESLLVIAGGGAAMAVTMGITYTAINTYYAIKHHRDPWVRDINSRTLDRIPTFRERWGAYMKNGSGLAFLGNSEYVDRHVLKKPRLGSPLR